ncbi:hypothetical protein L914_19366, partial [Phytophthora nicotianae]
AALLSVGAVDFEGALNVESLADRSYSAPRYALPAKHTLEHAESRYKTKDGKEGTKRRWHACK